MKAVPTLLKGLVTVDKNKFEGFEK